MLKRKVAALAAAVTFIGGAAFAQVCGGQYTVKSGDSLSQIADAQYKDAGKWTAIHTANIKLIGEAPDRIQVGQVYNLPCINGLPTGLVQVEQVELTSAPVSDDAAVKTTGPRTSIRLVTADDFAPFTDRSLPQGGLFNELVDEAMASVQPKDNYKIYVVNDWDSHMQPLMEDAVMDLGYPWYLPDCSSSPRHWRCDNLIFSEPMFETLILLFTNRENPVLYRSDHDLHGKTICRPMGYSDHVFDRDGRNLAANNLITVVKPDGVDRCFELLARGEVDGVGISEFTGRAMVKQLGLEDVVETANRPISIEGLHVVVSTQHPEAQELIDLVNEGITKIRENGIHQKVVDAHLERIWAEF